MAEKFQIGKLITNPGQKGFGWIKLSDTYYGELKIPLIVVNGANPGKVLFLGTGIHGTEYVGMDAMLRFIHEFDVSVLYGKIIAIPMINIPAFEAISREGPFDSLNLNRVFPGKKTGFLTEQIANLLIETVLPHVDYIIDLHGATLNDMQLNVCGFEESDRFSSLDMAKAFGIESLWRMATSGIKGTFTGAATEKGIPSIIVEVGGEGRCREEWVQFEMQGIKNVMKVLGLIEGTPEGLPSRYRIIEGFYQHAAAGGFLRPQVKLGDWIKQETILGVIIDLHGNVLEEIKSSSDGLIMGMRTLPKINPGDWSFWVGTVKEEIEG
ncbi:MAG: succinylglutamate desuccinylase/aspartoacylase family protein [Spirochaetota bacterium]|nr:MAG: succinylglutamate desuccinylase/aspartoacylase family protein [Spirochaetota bacterium]